MSLVSIVNPSRRRRRRKASKARRRHSRRPMTAKQLKYFGKRRRKARTITVTANPRRRRSRRMRRNPIVRRFRRNPSAVRAPRLSMSYVTDAAKIAVIGAGGAIGTDMAMTQAVKFLPAPLASRVGADGSVNFGYYGVKAALAIGLGALGSMLAKGRMRATLAQATAGALTVQVNELARMMLPADLVLGYMNPGVLARNRLRAYMTAKAQGQLPPPRKGMGAYFAASAGGSSINTDMSETRVGEGSIS